MQRPFLPLIIVFLAGIVIAASGLSSFSVPLLIIILGILTALMLFAFKKKKAFYIVLCLFFFFLGALRYTSAATLSHENISNFLGEVPKKTILYGDVVSLPERRGRHFNEHYIFDLKAFRMLTGDEEYSVSGLVRVKVFGKDKAPSIGDALVIEGAAYLAKGKTNPAGFDYKRYLMSKGINALITSRAADIYEVVTPKAAIKQRVLGNIGKFRIKAQKIINKHLSGEAAGIIEASLLGTRGGLSMNFKDIFTKTGTMHILAVSGLHVGIVAMTVVFLLKIFRFPVKITYLAGILAICAFAFFTGARPSTVRAAIMGSFVLLGLMSGRRTDLVSGLFLSAFLICFFRPLEIFDAGFILSYSAVLSIIYLTPVTDASLGAVSLEKTRSFISKTKVVLLKSLSVSIAICIGMMPVVAYYFRIITPSSVLANLVAVPFLFLMIVLGSVVVGAGSIPILAPVASVFASILTFLITLFARVMDTLGSLPLSHFRVPAPHAVLFILYYGALIALIYAFKKGKGSWKTLLVFVLFASNLFIWSMVMMRPQLSRIVFFDTGRSDAFLIETEEGGVTLIDTGLGDKYTSFSSGSSIIAPYLWQRGHSKIDNMLITHFHDDHVGGSAYLVDNFKIGNIIIGKGLKPEKGDELNNYIKFMSAVESAPVKVEEGDTFKVDGVSFTVLNPARKRSNDQNTDSVAVKANIESGPSILFTGDINSDSMKSMMKYGHLLKSDIIKIPHHGKGMGEEYIVTEFLKMVSPDYAIIPNNRIQDLNRYILKVLEEIGAEIFVTGDSGAVIVDVGDEGKWTVTSFRE